MSLDELKTSIDGKSFSDQNGTNWFFLHDTMSSKGVGENDISVHYEFIQTDGIIYLQHSGSFPTNNDLIVDVFEENPLELTLTDSLNLKKVFVLS